MNKFLDIPKQKTFTDLGLDQFGQSPLSFAGAEINRKTQTMNEAEVPSNFIQTGDIIQRLNLIDGYLQSNNFATGSTGWRIDSDGNVEFNNGTFRGTLSAASGTLGAITVGTNAWHIDSSGNMWWGSSSTYAGATIKISSAGVAYLSNAIISGTITAGAGSSVDWSYIANVSVTSAQIVSLNADKINVGTLTGFTIQTAASGYRTVMTSANGLQLYNGATLVGTIKADTASSVILDTADNFYFTEDVGSWRGTLDSNGWNLPTGKSYQFASGRKLTDKSDGIDCNGGFASNQDDADFLGRSNKRWSNLYATNSHCNNYFAGDGSQGENFNDDIVTSIYLDGDYLKYKYRNFSWKDGLLTSHSGSESTQTVGRVIGNG